MSRAQAKTIPLEVRVSRQARDALARAAEIRGRSLSDFVIFAALNMAHRVIAYTQVIRLSRDPFDIRSPRAFFAPRVVGMQGRACRFSTIEATTRVPNCLAGHGAA